MVGKDELLWGSYHSLKGWGLGSASRLSTSFRAFPLRIGGSGGFCVAPFARGRRMVSIFTLSDKGEK
jgi:hypothetical protein